MSRRANRWRWLLGLASTLVAVVVAACGGSTERRPAASDPTLADRRAIHDGLERIGRACSTDRRRPAGDRVVFGDVQKLIVFRRRYPTQRFAVEEGGETGTMFSVLLVARSELVGCSPPAVEAIDRFIPPRVRKALPPPRGSGTG